jgi:hypothetical protein
MDMDDMDKVPHVLSTYIAPQTSMVLLCKKKQAEYEGKSQDEITTLLAKYMVENNMSVSNLSETVEHECADEFIKTIETINESQDIDKGALLVRSFSIPSTGGSSLSHRYRHSSATVMEESPTSGIATATVGRAVSMGIRLSQRY